MISPSSPVSVAVVGASGFIGAAVVAALEAAGPSVGHVQRVSGRTLFSEDTRATYEVVVHAAGRAHRRSTREQFDTANVSLAGNVVDWSADHGASRVVLLSSVAVYGSGAGPSRDDSPAQPSDEYGRSKLRGEQLAAERARERGTELVILRLTTTFGSGDPGNVGRLIDAVERRRFAMIGRGANRKGLIHRDDAGRAVAAAVLAPTPFDGTFNVSAGCHSMRSVVDEIHTALDRRKPRRCLPEPPLRLQARVPRLKTWFSDGCVDPTEFMRRTGWKPSVDLGEGLREAAGRTGSTPS